MNYIITIGATMDQLMSRIGKKMGTPDNVIGTWCIGSCNKKGGARTWVAKFRRVVYRGERTEAGTAVTANGRQITQVVRHSPDGMEWGYGGSGPADLALTLLTDAVGPELAEKHYQNFKWEKIATIADRKWKIGSEEIVAWVRAKEKVGGA